MKRKKTNRSYKSWISYFLDFLMVFFAVFLGFFADNLRDTYSENTKEKKYIASLIEDVRLDKINIQNAFEMNQMRKGKLDTLSQLLFNYKTDTPHIKKLYNYYFIILVRPDFFTPHEVTMLQLKNAGGMRLIKKKEVIREILQYDLQSKKLYNQQRYYENYQNNAINLGLKVFSQEPFQTMEATYLKTGKAEFDFVDFRLIQDNELALTELANAINMYSGIVNYYNSLLKETDKKADSLIAELQHNYQLN